MKLSADQTSRERVPLLLQPLDLAVDLSNANIVLRIGDDLEASEEAGTDVLGDRLDLHDVTFQLCFGLITQREKSANKRKKRVRVDSLRQLLQMVKHVEDVVLPDPGVVEDCIAYDDDDHQ